MSRETWREVAAEFLGTFVLVTFGVAVVAQVLLGNKANGDYLSINLGWGLAVTMGIYVAGGVTGAHLNPAVTLAMAVLRDFGWGRVIPYIAAQVAAAFVASAVVYAVYHEALARHPRDLSTAGIWATYPNTAFPLSNVPGGLVDQIVGTALLVGVIFGISDKRNLSPESNLGPVIVGALVLLIGMTFGLNCGYAINPARDFGPRLFTYFAGWGGKVFEAHDGWWWVPIIGPLIGGVVGGAVYDLFITRLHPRR
ncbi:MAG: MIP family channel protein [Pirellulales bacterium]|nr:MIP family channel protein [Pirellulales bacterium]